MQADLWSVGAILFQLVTGKLPFDGNTHYQLFQNIMASDELQFPQDVLASLHPDCVNLCRRLMRRNPVERLAFEEFFNHNFLAKPRTTDFPIEPKNIQDVGLGDAGPSNSSDVGNSEIASTEKGFTLMNSSRVADSLEFIEQEYVLVNANFGSLETLPSSFEPSLSDDSTTRMPSYKIKMIEKGYAAPVQSQEQAAPSVNAAATVESHVSPFSSVPHYTVTVSEEVHDTSSLHPSSRIQRLSQYMDALVELAQEKLNAGLHLESFSVELIILAVWRQTMQLCKIWMASSNDQDYLPRLSTNYHQSHETDHFSQNITVEMNFTNPLLVCSWAERGFLVAYDRAEKLSNGFQDTDGDPEMPDAMEVIFQSALTFGKNGAVEELMEHWSGAVASYSKAITYLTFIMVEAMLLPLDLPFSLSPLNQQRLDRYISNLRTRLKKSQLAEHASRQNH
ncbi:serine/threonine-protein kinase ATG1a isoform X1 [Canna indica]|uniref:Serine/threonine-protein kinase ATG1a isoform X1 n=1 Tax=Canna indica TaxID=4628 RepID=A0AAQ3Q739_9LILI|nr:serine/threonine-protein kinase ATG1a isoform X1 [Canna indica]